jgi:branched chain amino acid efflux pump
MSTPTRSTPRRSRIDPDALRECGPMVLSMAPFGLLIGFTLSTHPIGAGPGLLTGALLFAGTAHFTALSMIATGAGPLAVLTTVIAINSRLLLYGAALQPRFAGQPGWFRWLGPFVLTDQTFAMAERRPRDEDPARFRRYWSTAGLLIYACWTAIQVLGALLAPVLPEHLPLEVAGPAVLVGLLVPHLRRRTGRTAALVGGAVAAVASPLPAGVGTLVAAAAGLVAATLVGRRGARS